jgi:pimeloyl-ACP methyl ester carboxylesterase
VKKVAMCAAAAVVAFAFAGCQAKETGGASTTDTAATENEAGSTVAPEAVTFATSDGWEIYATYWNAGEGKPAALLLHMLPADRRSYDDFGSRLAAAGFNVLALDSRGHGESLKHNGKVERYTDFGDDEHRSSVADVAAAKTFLAGKGADTSRTVIVGASIGANFALNHAASDADVRAVVLLSPGLNYHGVMTADAMSAYGDRPAYLVASEEDSYSADSVGKLHEIAGGAELVLFKDAGHGTNIFKAEPSFVDTLVTWLAAQAAK